MAEEDFKYYIRGLTDASIGSTDLITSILSWDNTGLHLTGPIDIGAGGGAFSGSGKAGLVLQVLGELELRYLNSIDFVVRRVTAGTLYAPGGSDTPLSIMSTGEVRLDNVLNLQDNYQDIAQIAAPANPGAGVRRIFMDTATGELSVRTSAGTTVSLESGGGGGIATDPIWDALGDTVYGTGANTGAKLAGQITTTRKFLRQVGDGAISAAPAWDTLLAGDIPSLAHSSLSGVTADQHHAQSHSHASHTGLAADDHAQYALLAGRLGGQTLVGGSAIGDPLLLRATSGVPTSTLYLGGATVAFGTAIVDLDSDATVFDMSASGTLGLYANKPVSPNAYMTLGSTTQTFGSSIATLQFEAAGVDLKGPAALNHISVRFSDATVGGGPSVEFTTGVLNINENCDIQNHIAIGTATGGPSAVLGAVLKLGEAATATSGDIRQLDIAMTAAPAGASSAAYRGLYLDVSNTTAQTLTGFMIGLQFVVTHDQSVNANALYGLYGQMRTGISTTDTRTPTVGDGGDVHGTNTGRGIYGQAVAQGFFNSAAATAISTSMAAGWFETFMRMQIGSGSGLITATELNGVYIRLIVDASGGTSAGNRSKVTAFHGLYVDPGLVTATGATITTGIGARIAAWPAGPAYTNGPYGISQEGADLNWLRGTTEIGNLVAGTRPTSIPAQLTVSQVTLGNEVLRLRSVATADDPVLSIYQNRGQTTDAATPLTLHTIAIAASMTVTIEVYVTARRTGGLAGAGDDGASYILYGTYTTKAGVVTAMGSTPVQHIVHEDQAGWNATLVISGTNVIVQVTGAFLNTVVWHAEARVRQIGT